ncbi:MAG: hypothetical protein H7838_09330 [Magnetococcus sp. DMHC-8]
MKVTTQRGVPARVDILLFRMGGLSLGVLLNHLDAVTSPNPEEMAGKGVLLLSDLLDFRGLVTAWRAPRVLRLKGGNGRCAVLIDRPEKIVTIAVEDVQFLPDFLTVNHRRGAWLGAFIASDGLPVLLLDLPILCGGTGPGSARVSQPGDAE